MKRSFPVRLAILLLATSMLAGCILVPVDDGYRGGDYQERGRGDHHGERHDGPGGLGNHR